VWVDLDTPTAADLQLLATELGLHPLSVEDALDPHQRDRYVHFEHHVFLVCHGVELSVEDATLAAHELDVFVGDGWMVTVHSGQGPRELLDAVLERWDHVRHIVGTNAGVAVYAILSVLGAGYFEAIDRFEEFYDDAADRVFGESPIEPSAHRHWFEMRRALNQFHRVVRPLSSALGTMVDKDIQRFALAAAPYLQDAAAELDRAASEVAGLRELVDHLVDANLVLRDYRQNLVMKKVTSWAAIIAVPTLVTGYFGMNVPFPGAGETWGVATSTSVALGCSAGLYALFKRRGWL
jgi:magnesium transporter